MDIKDSKIEMKKNQTGSLTIDATITLTFMMFFIMFLLNFGIIYQAQNFMRHSLLQASKSISYLSFRYELYEGESAKDNSILQGLEFVETIVGGESGLGLNIAYSGNDIEEAIRIALEADNPNDPNDMGWDELTNKYRVHSIDLSGSELTEEDIFIKASYRVELPFPFLGYQEVQLHNELKTGKFGKPQ